MVKATATSVAKRNNVLICKISFVNLALLTAWAGNHFENIELCLKDRPWTESSESFRRCLARLRQTSGHLPEFEAIGSGYKGSSSPTSSCVRKRTPYSLKRCKICCGSDSA